MWLEVKYGDCQHCLTSQCCVHGDLHGFEPNLCLFFTRLHWSNVPLCSSSLRIRKRTTRRLTCLTLPTIHLAAYCIWVNEAKAVSADLIDCVKIWVSAVRRHFNPALAARWMRETSIWRLFSLTSSLTVWSWGRKQVWLNSRDCERRGRRWREGVLSKVSLGIKTKELNIKSLLVCVRDVMLFPRGALA